MTQKITPNIWFNGNAREAAEFYTSIFPDGKITSTVYYPKSREEGLADFQLNMAGKELTVEYEIGGLHFTAINAGPEFTPNPSISFLVNFDPSQDDHARERLDELWEKLSEDGKVIMALKEYPYSKHYGWVQDKYGVNWQLMLTNPNGESRPFIIPSLLFTKENANHAEEAMAFYLQVFNNAKLGMVARYPVDSGPSKKGSVMFADFTLEGQWFAAMDTGVEEDFTFTEGISLAVTCKDQAEIDELWEQLSAVPEAEQCGWCKDKYGVSWQIVPANMDELMQKPDAYAHLMQMKKIVIADF